MRTCTKKHQLEDLRYSLSKKQKESLEFMQWDGIDFYDAMERILDGEVYNPWYLLEECVENEYI